MSVTCAAGGCGNELRAEWSRGQLTFPALTAVARLALAHGQVTTASFPALRSAGTLVVIYNPTLTTLELPALETASVRLLIDFNGALTTLSLPSLKTVGGDLTLDSNRALTSVSMPALAMADGGLMAVNSRALTSLELPALATVSGTLNVSNDGALGALSFPALTSLGGLVVQDNAALRQCLVDDLNRSARPNLYMASGNGGTPNTCP